MTDKVQKIREEVARIQLYTQSEVLKQVIGYIDEVQKDPVSEDLNEAAKEYATHVDFAGNKTLIGNEADAFIAGAKWQKQQDMKYGYVTALQGEKRFANFILEMIANGWHIEAIKTACKDKINEE